MIKTRFLAAGAALSLLALNAVGKVSMEEAEKLDTVLTPIGAERAGNKEGTIPPWNPDFKAPANYKPGSHYPNPYADEKPILVITKDNYKDHKDKLTPSLQKLFKSFSRTFKIKVYPSHRDGGYDDFYLTQAKLNAVRAELIDSGNGVINAFGSTPFPIPQSGVEVAWNMTLTANPFYREWTYDDVMVYRNGKHLLGRTSIKRISPYSDPDSDLASYEKEEHPFVLGVTKILKPSREKGKVVLVHDTIKPETKPRAAWSYTPGVRRVRRAPTVAYDTPQGLGKIRTTDSSYGFNGDVDKYEWKIVGKKEMYIPYNNYDFENPDLDYKELLPKGHPNPEHLRFELHRVWVLEANLRKGERHVYKKRQIFIDEDSWLPIIADNYDNRGKLWRFSMTNTINMFDLPGVRNRTTFYFDFNRREYLASEMYNKQKQVAVNTKVKELSYFTPANLRKLGVR